MPPSHAEDDEQELPDEYWGTYDGDEPGVSMGHAESDAEADGVMETFKRLMNMIQEEKKIEQRAPAGFTHPPAKKRAVRKGKRHAGSTKRVIRKR